jgi:hypothetical protein
MRLAMLFAQLMRTDRNTVLDRRLVDRGWLAADLTLWMFHS